MEAMEIEASDPLFSPTGATTNLFACLVALII